VTGALCKDKPGTPSASRDKFVEPTGPFALDAIPAWSKGLASVTEDTARDQKARKIQYYVFPDPGLILGATNNRKAAIYLTNWMRFRLTWIWQSIRNVDGLLMSAQLWRDVLYHGLGTGNAKLGAKSHARISKMVHFVDGRLNSEGLLDFPTPGPSTSPLDPPLKVAELMWRGEKVALDSDGMPATHIVAEVIWELYELGFRFDLVSLDRQLAGRLRTTTEDVLARQHSIVACFPMEDGDDIIPWASANRGLGDPYLERRRPYILALARLMKDWLHQDRLPAYVVEMLDEKMDHVRLRKFEESVTQYYCHISYLVLGRAAITPHRLPRRSA
jgi:hypothetical protein